MRYYLGRPDTFGMLAMPPASRGTSTGLSRDEATVALGSGGTAITRALDTKRSDVSWSFDPVDALDGDAAQQWARLRDLYRGLYGRGPFRLIDPNDVNLMHVADTTLRTVGRWAVTAGTLAASATALTDPRGSGLRWTIGTAAGVLHCGPVVGTDLSAGTPDLMTAVPYLADRPLLLTATVQMTAGPAKSITLRVSRYTVGGATVQQFGLDVNVTAPQRLRLYVPAGALGATSTGWVTIAVVARDGGSSASVLRLSYPQIEYPLGLSDVQPRPWEAGMGSPVVGFRLGSAKMALHRQRSFSASVAEL